jgi:transcriptional regulator with XRE-family HTH domain
MSSREEVKRLLQEGLAQKAISKQLGISEARVSQLKRALNLPLKSPLKLASEAHILTTPSLKLRLHRLQRSYAILNAISEDKLRSLKLNRLNNTDQYIGAGFRVTSRSLELEGMELVSDPRLPVAVLEGIAYSLADNTASRIAASYGFTIAKEGHTPLKLTEIELSATQMTEKMEKKGLIELYSDAEGYKVWVDWSFGIGGLESNRPLYLQRLTDFSIDLAEHDAWNTLKEAVPKLAQTVMEIREELKVHRSAYRALERVAVKLDKRLSQQRLFP